MRADGYTHVAEGVGWGLRVISPGEPFTEGVEYSNEDITKAMVLLTDGENTFDTENNHNHSTYTAYGFLHRHGWVRPTTGLPYRRRIRCWRVPATM